MDAVWIVDRLRRGAALALAGDRDGTSFHPLVRGLERELRALGRTVLWIDLSDVESGGHLAGRLVEACLPELDPEVLGDVLERVPMRGPIDVDAFAELLMLPETLAAERGGRVVAILDGFEWVERTIGMTGLMAVRDVLATRQGVAYLFVGSRRLAALFGRPDMPLYGLAEVVESPARRSESGHREPRASKPDADTTEPTPDPLAAALLHWAEPPEPPAPRRTSAEEAWERLIAREAEMRHWLAADDGDDRRRARRRRRR